MHDWLVGGGVIEGPGGLLLVENQRRDRRLDWSPPGGVIDPGESVVAGLTREVREETGLHVRDWTGPIYEIRAEAIDMQWHLRVEAYLATRFEGDVVIADPDGIVVRADFCDAAARSDRLATSPRWVREPLEEWLTERWSGCREFAYLVRGSTRASLDVERR